MAAYFTGLLRIDFSTYLAAFMFSGLLLLLAAVMVLFIGASHSGRKQETAPVAAI